MSSIAGWRAAGQPLLTAWGVYQLGQVQRAQGRLDAAVRTYQQTLEIAAVPGLPPAPPAGSAYVGLGEVAYQRNELDSALRQVTEGIALCRQFLYPAPLATGLVTLAWIRQAQGDPGRGPGGDGRGRAGRAGPGCDRPAQPRPGAAGAAAAGPGRGRRGRPLDQGTRPRMRTTSRATRRSRSIWCWPGCCSRKTAPARRSGCWSGCTRRRPPRAGRAASSRSGALQALALAGRRRGGRRGGRPGRGADPGLPAGLCPGVRR